jgi:hypothetical protein
MSFFFSILSKEIIKSQSLQINKARFIEITLKPKIKNKIMNFGMAYSFVVESER